MTLLNVVSIAVTAVVWIVFVILWRKYRRHVRDGEGALAVLDASSEGAEPPRDGVGDAPAPDIVFVSDKVVLDKIRHVHRQPCEDEGRVESCTYEQLLGRGDPHHLFNVHPDLIDRDQKH